MNYSEDEASMTKIEDEMAHLRLDHHLISHLTLSLHAQPSNHDDHITQFGQGLPNTLMTLGDRLPHGSFGHTIHHEQSLARVCGVRPNEKIFA